LAYVITDDDEVGMEETPILRAGGVVELKAVVGYSGSKLEDKRLVQVAEEGYVAVAGGLMDTLTDASVRC
jgi:hypothetical protein